MAMPRHVIGKRVSIDRVFRFDPFDPLMPELDRIELWEGAEGIVEDGGDHGRESSETVTKFHLRLLGFWRQGICSKKKRRKQGIGVSFGGKGRVVSCKTKSPSVREEIVTECDGLSVHWMGEV